MQQLLSLNTQSKSSSGQGESLLMPATESQSANGNEFARALMADLTAQQPAQEFTQPPAELSKQLNSVALSIEATLIKSDSGNKLPPVAGEPDVVGEPVEVPVLELLKTVHQVLQSPGAEQADSLESLTTEQRQALQQLEQLQLTDEQRQQLTAELRALLPVDKKTNESEELGGAPDVFGGPAEEPVTDEVTTSTEQPIRDTLAEIEKLLGLQQPTQPVENQPHKQLTDEQKEQLTAILKQTSATEKLDAGQADTEQAKVEGNDEPVSKPVLNNALAQLQDVELSDEQRHQLSVMLKELGLVDKAGKINGDSDIVLEPIKTPISELASAGDKQDKPAVASQTKTNELNQLLQQLKQLLSHNETLAPEQNQQIKQWLKEHEGKLNQASFNATLTSATPSGAAAEAVDAEKQQREQLLNDLKSLVAGQPDTARRQAPMSLLPGELAQPIESVSNAVAQATTDLTSSIAATEQQQGVASVSTTTGSIKPTEMSTTLQSTMQAIQKPFDPQQSEASQKLQERINIMLSKNIQRADIRIDPPELGQLQVRINMNSDQATVQFQVQTPQAREAIENAMPRLREMLEQQGVALADTDVKEQQHQQHAGDQFGESAGGGGFGEAEGEQMEHEIALNNGKPLTAGAVDFYV